MIRHDIRLLYMTLYCVVSPYMLLGYTKVCHIVYTTVCLIILCYVMLYYIMLYCITL